MPSVLIDSKSGNSSYCSSEDSSVKRVEMQIPSNNSNPSSDPKEEQKPTTANKVPSTTTRPKLRKNRILALAAKGALARHTAEMNAGRRSRQSSGGSDSHHQSSKNFRHFPATFRNQTPTEVHSTEDKECFLCGESAEEKLRKCRHCDLVWFCSWDHFNIHRKPVLLDKKTGKRVGNTGGNGCFPFVIKRSPSKGRFMVAVRNIKPLELILWEEPAVVGPYSKVGGHGCLDCFKKFDKSRPRFHCPRCDLPVCDEGCSRGHRHQIECRYFQSLNKENQEDKANNNNNETGNDNEETATDNGSDNNINDNNQKETQDRQGSIISKKTNKEYFLQDNSPIFITPLRMLIKRRTDPKTFSKIDMLMDHLDDNNSGNDNQTSTDDNISYSNTVTGPVVNLQTLKVVLSIQEHCSKKTGMKIKPEFGHKDIQRMMGILKTNGMRLEMQGDQGIPGVALYPIYCLINHACVNNTNYVKFPDLHLELRSQVAIAKGGEITTRYISSTFGNCRRREDIRRNWLFDCECARCSDITEMGTYMSAVRCLACKGDGYSLPTSALDYNSAWKCDSCDAVMEGSTMKEVVTAIEDQIESQAGDVENLEEMLFHYEALLHPNHYILIDVMHTLVHLYTSKASLTRPEKERKIQLCETVLRILSRVDPGYTKWKGTLLQELIHPLMMISKEDHNNKVIDQSEFHRRLTLCSRMLDEAKMCLRGGFTTVENYVKVEPEDQEEENV